MACTLLWGPTSEASPKTSSRFLSTMKSQKKGHFSPSPPTHLQSKEASLTIFQAGKVRSLLRAVLLEQEDELLESLQEKKTKTALGLLNLASSACGNFGAVTANSAPKHRRKERFLNGKCSLLLWTVIIAACAFNSLLRLDSQVQNELRSSSE